MVLVLFTPLKFVTVHILLNLDLYKPSILWTVFLTTTPESRVTLPILIYIISFDIPPPSSIMEDIKSPPVLVNILNNQCTESLPYEQVSHYGTLEPMYLVDRDLVHDLNDRPIVTSCVTKITACPADEKEVSDILINQICSAYNDDLPLNTNISGPPDTSSDSTADSLPTINIVETSNSYSTRNNSDANIFFLDESYSCFCTNPCLCPIIDINLLKHLTPAESTSPAFFHLPSPPPFPQKYLYSFTLPC